MVYKMTVGDANVTEIRRSAVQSLPVAFSQLQEATSCQTSMFKF